MTTNKKKPKPKIKSVTKNLESSQSFVRAIEEANRPVIEKSPTTTKRISMSFAEYKKEMDAAGGKYAKQERESMKLKLTPLYQFLLRHKWDTQFESAKNTFNYSQFSKDLNEITKSLFAEFKND